MHMLKLICKAYFSGSNHYVNAKSKVMEYIFSTR